MSELVLDFAPDLLAIQERPPARLPRAIALTTTALVGLLVAWASFAHLDIIASADGRLVPLSYTKVVQPAEGGVVTDILVKDGDVVKQGQVMLRLDARLSQADTAALGQEFALRQLTLRRIDAELSDREFLMGKNEPAALFAQVESQYRARRQAYLDALSQEREAQNKARAEMQAAQQVLAKLTQTLPTYRQTADAYRKLVQEGFVGELAAAEKAREAIEREQDLKAQAESVRSLELSIAQSDRRLASVRSQYRAQLESERVEALAPLHRSGQELEKARVREGMLEVRAPNDGVVKDLVPTTRGTVVSAGAMLMNIVPREEPLQAEVQLRNEDVGFTATGQPVKVKVAAYPFQKYGMLDGTVVLVGADSADPKQRAPGEPPTLSYRALIRLETDSLRSQATGEQLVLSPGMAVTTEIQQGRRTVLEYLFSPVLRVAREAARER